MDAAFTNIIDTDRLAVHGTREVNFTDVPVRFKGEFGRLSGNSRIKGRIYGSVHGELAGVFESCAILGTFGAKR